MSTKAKSLARRLLRENRKLGRSWRVIAREDFNDKINNTTLCRFAKSKGEWLPKDNDILITLGLKHAPQSKPKLIFDMSADELLYALNNRQLMPKVSPLFRKVFKQLGYKNIRVRVGAR